MMRTELRRRAPRGLRGTRSCDGNGDGNCFGNGSTRMGPIQTDRSPRWTRACIATRPDEFVLDRDAPARFWWLTERQFQSKPPLSPLERYSCPARSVKTGRTRIKRTQFDSDPNCADGAFRALHFADARTCGQTLRCLRAVSLLRTRRSLLHRLRT